MDVFLTALDENGIDSNKQIASIETFYCFFNFFLLKGNWFIMMNY